MTKQLGKIGDDQIGCDVCAAGIIHPQPQRTFIPGEQCGVESCITSRVNIIQHINIFRSKEAVIEFARKVEAEHILGVKPKVRPKTFTYISRYYTESDLEEI